MKLDLERNHRGRSGRIGSDIVLRLKQHDLMMMAASIAFYWLLGLLPLLLLWTSDVAKCWDPRTEPWTT